MKKLTALLCIVLGSLPLLTFAQEESEISILEHYRRRCINLIAYTTDDIPVICRYNFHHFNATDEHYAPSSKSRIQIGSFNILHPGSNKTLYKDNKVIAKIINRYDVMAGLELLANVSNDYSHNESILAFLKKAPSLIEVMIEKVFTTTNSQQRLENAQRLDKLISDFEEARRLYRKPGYLLILDELRKLDPTWSLILTPRGEAATEKNTQELTGFYYRSSVVTTRVNPYCKNLDYDRMGPPYACLPQFNTEFFGTDVSELFSRRPFMASFQSGNFNFTLLAAHVIYTSPTDEEKMKRILKASFGTDDYTTLGTGINKGNYARFAEVKLTLDYIRKYKKEFNDENIIYMGDFNLESKNQFWDKVLDKEAGEILTHDALSTLTHQLNDSSGTPTMGLSSNFDHMIFQESDLDECTKYDKLDIETYNFMEDKELLQEYLVYELTESKREKIINKFKSEILEKFTNYKTIKYNAIAPEYSEENLELIANNLVERVFTSQLSDESFYRVYAELISDHLPIGIGCKI